MLVRCSHTPFWVKAKDHDICRIDRTAGLAGLIAKQTFERILSQISSKTCAFLFLAKDNIVRMLFVSEFMTG
jgi:hypothetical protein